LRTRLATEAIVSEGAYGVGVPATSIRSGVSPDALLDDLDPEQRQVAVALTGPLAVIAGAGTGKTRAITYRIAYGVATGTYNPTSVLAVTFTTRAAGELRARLQQLGAYGVQARTFHSAALRQAQYFWPRVYGGELPHVLDNRMGLVAEAARCVEERVVGSPEDADYGMILGTGFAPFRGGPLRFAEHFGLKEIVEELERLARTEEKFTPCEILKKHARDGTKFYEE
jgi:superfamily I DNA/RNA helicase